MHKAKGLAEFAKKHAVRFGRIQLIIKEGDELLRLDLTSKRTSDAVSVIDSAEALKHLYETQHLKP